MVSVALCFCSLRSGGRPEMKRPGKQNFYLRFLCLHPLSSAFVYLFSCRFGLMISVSTVGSSDFRFPLLFALVCPSFLAGELRGGACHNLFAHAASATWLRSLQSAAPTFAFPLLFALVCPSFLPGQLRGGLAQSFAHCARPLYGLFCFPPLRTISDLFYHRCRLCLLFVPSPNLPSRNPVVCRSSEFASSPTSFLKFSRPVVSFLSALCPRTEDAQTSDTSGSGRRELRHKKRADRKGLLFESERDISIPSTAKRRRRFSAHSRGEAPASRRLRYPFSSPGRP